MTLNEGRYYENVSDFTDALPWADAHKLKMEGWELLRMAELEYDEMPADISKSAVHRKSLGFVMGLVEGRKAAPPPADEHHEVAAAIAGIGWTKTSYGRWAYVYKGKDSTDMGDDEKVLKTAIDKADGKLAFEGKEYSISKAKFFNEK